MRKRRKDSAMTMKELAEQSGVSIDTICQYEHDRRDPRMFNLWALADALEVSIDEYIGRTGND